MGDKLACFKAYDIRGRVPQDLNDDMAYKLGRAYVSEIEPHGPVAVGRDIRLSSEDLAQALIRGINDGGADTRDIGLCGTEMVYFAASRSGMGGGIMVTASHNPMEYNGFKLVREKAIPISGDSGLQVLERRVRENDIGERAPSPGRTKSEDVTQAYVQKLLSFTTPDKLKPLKLVVNAGNGCAGPILDALAHHLPFEFIRLQHKPDGTFPNGIPNPLLEENRPVTANAVTETNADLGIAWDGDFDRCFFFDETGSFVDGYYIVGLLAKRMLEAAHGAVVIHDPRMTWNTIDIVKQAGGIPMQGKTGHAFMKERMRKENAVYGGEMSAHHYFRDFAYCDSGMIPWLVITLLMSETEKPLSELVLERKQKYPGSGEINSRVDDANTVIDRIRAHYADQATSRNEVDGLSMEFDHTWRFNVRPSQTEPILRLNVETKEDPQLLKQKTDELLRLIRG
ncbi:MAG: phosphomannomutase [Candidatus Pacebacteria bacterium]|nr:phosphomannomutase [Candidatus Paceibacterota bacterium]